MKKLLAVLVLVGLGFVGCGGNDSTSWAMGAFQQGNRVLKSYCTFNQEKGFRYSLLYMDLDEQGKAKLVPQEQVQESFNAMSANPRMSKIFEGTEKSTIYSFWKDDPSACASVDMALGFMGLQRMDGIEVRREK